ncbi:MAG: hypothetical protein CMK08_18420 [Ponticaulis sp.]|nr:hypothetical protein [Ponticaulis sp.]
MGPFGDDLCLERTARRLIDETYSGQVPFDLQVFVGRSSHYPFCWFAPAPRIDGIFGHLTFAVASAINNKFDEQFKDT